MPATTTCRETYAVGLARGTETIEVIWASTREVWNVIEADRIGCHIITAPADILKKLEGLGRAPEDISLDTVKGFVADAKAGRTDAEGVRAGARASNRASVESGVERGGQPALDWRHDHARPHSRATRRFRPLPGCRGFIGLAGPYFWRAMAEGAVEYGFRAEARHGNPNGVLHGGSITTFIDTVLGYEVIRQTRRRCATISLTTEFVAAASRAPG